MNGNMYESTCQDKVGRDGRSYRGCGQKITMYNNGVKWMAYSVTKDEDGRDQWVEHRTVCAARQQQQQQQQQTPQFMQPPPPPPQQPPMPNVGASLPRDDAMMQSDRLIELQHEIGQVKKQQTSIVFLLQEIAKKLEVIPKEDAANQK